MKLKEARFVKSGTRLSHYPGGSFPEAAFCGRSNVGKSSLINCLLNRRALARTGSTPGRTRLINFYLVNQQFYFADLPGFGYARVSGEMRQDWKRMVEDYLEKRSQLKVVVLIVDLRRGLAGEELEFLDWLELRGKKVLVVATKSDKLKRQERARARQALEAQIGERGLEVIEFSSVSREGREQLWEALEKALFGNVSV